VVNFLSCAVTSEKKPRAKKKGLAGYKKFSSFRYSIGMVFLKPCCAQAPVVASGLTVPVSVIAIAWGRGTSDNLAGRDRLSCETPLLFKPQRLCYDDRTRHAAHSISDFG
jgi:hypothetical protein